MSVRHFVPEMCRHFVPKGVESVTRTAKYVAVAEHRWIRYVQAVGIAKRLLHFELFYTGAPTRGAKGGCCEGERVVPHPLLGGAIGPGDAKGERSRHRGQSIYLDGDTWRYTRNDKQVGA